MRLFAALLFAVFLPFPLQAASDVSSPAPHAAQAAGLRALIDKPVITMQGDSVGVLKSVAVDVGTGEVPWAVVLTGLNLVVVPVAALNFDRSGLLMLRMSPKDFDNAPRWRSTDMPLLNRPPVVEAISKAYGFRMEASQNAVAAVGEGTPYRLIGTPISRVPTEDFGNHVRLIGDRVITVSGQPVGTIVDLLIEMDTAVVRQVAVEGDGRRIALPFKALVWQVNAGTFATALSLTDMKRQPTAAWPDGKAVLLAPAR